MPAWATLCEPEYQAVWDRFDSEFRFRPSVSAFPGIDEPTPSRTYALAGEWTDADVDEFHGRLLVALRAACRRGDRLYALDWQHECYWFDPHAADEPGWKIGLPDGDYAIFLTADLRCGIFGHPWEWTCCVFGEPLMRRFSVGRPMMFAGVARERPI